MYYLHPYKALTSNKSNIQYVNELMYKLLGGGPVVYGSEDAQILALSGFYPEDWPAVNFLSLLVYLWKRGRLDLPPLAAAPVANPRAFRGTPYGVDGVNIYFDFLRLRSQEARIINSFYHKSRPTAVVVFMGGSEFEIAATTEIAANTLAIRKITPSPHTPEGAATIKYSHALSVKIPPTPRNFEIWLIYVADVLNTVVKLPRVERQVVKVEKKEIYTLHGGRVVDDGVLIDNDVYIYI
ncbi:MAG: hypothetical protein QXK71_03615 [Pyrobaculum sp.]